MNYCRYCNHVLSSSPMAVDSPFYSHGRAFCTYCKAAFTVTLLVTKPAAANLTGDGGKHITLEDIKNKNS